MTTIRRPGSAAAPSLSSPNQLNTAAGLFSKLQRMKGASILPGTVYMTLKELFATADTDGSGELDKEEMAMLLLGLILHHLFGFRVRS